MLDQSRERSCLRLTSQNLNNNDFPWLKGKEILINKIPVRALRVNYVGELGWELTSPNKSNGGFIRCYL